MILIFLAVAAVLYLGFESVYSAHLRRRAREMTDARLQEEITRPGRYGGGLSICLDEIERREVVKTRLAEHK